PVAGAAVPRPLLLPSLDLYAAALVVYSLATGRAPYDHLGRPVRTTEHLLRVKWAEADGALLPISHEALSGRLGDERTGGQLFTLLSACLSPRPEERPLVGDARDFLEKLDASYQGTPLPSGEAYFGPSPLSQPATRATPRGEGSAG
ncbi:MAG: hypothetical protein D6731_12940, partial [Planctomycetota bacterium]